MFRITSAIFRTDSVIYKRNPVMIRTNLVIFRTCTEAALHVDGEPGDLLRNSLLVLRNRLLPSPLDVQEDDIVGPLAVALEVGFAHPQPPVQADVEAAATLLQETEEQGQEEQLEQ